VAIQIIRRHQHVLQQAALFLRTLLVDHIGEDEGELVAAIAADEAVAIDGGGQPQRTLLDHLVAAGIAEQAVDRLHAVEIDDADREGRRIVLSAVDQTVEFLHHPHLVAETGERIGIS
jgi:hypothetical protein